MKNFVIKWLEAVTSVAFLLIVVGFTIIALSAGPIGLLIGPLVGIVVGALLTGLVFTLLSINERLGNIQELLTKK